MTPTVNRRDTSKTAHSHPCKLTVDHTEEDHACICGRTWPRAAHAIGI